MSDQAGVLCVVAAWVGMFLFGFGVSNDQSGYAVIGMAMLFFCGLPAVAWVVETHTKERDREAVERYREQQREDRRRRDKTNS